MLSIENSNKDNINKARIATAYIFPKILYKARFCNNKSNQNLLSIDILKIETQKNLFATSVIRVEETYIKLLEKSDPQNFMQKKGKIIFLQCLKKVCEDFLATQYGYKVKIDSESFKKSLYTKNILKDLELIFQVPFYFY